MVPQIFVFTEELSHEHSAENPSDLPHFRPRIPLLRAGMPIPDQIQELPHAPRPKTQWEGPRLRGLRLHHAKDEPVAMPQAHPHQREDLRLLGMPGESARHGTVVLAK